MAGFALPALTVAAAVLLARSGVPHLHHRRALRRLLDQQALLPTPLRASVAVALGPVELALAAATVAALVGGIATEVVGALVTGLGAAFSVLLVGLARRRPATPCGCGGPTGPDDGGVGPLDALRAGTVLAGGLTLIGGAADRLAALGAAEAATTVIAGVATAAVIDVAARVRPPTPAAAGVTGADS